MLTSKDVNFTTEKSFLGSSCCGTVETNPTSIHEDAGSISGLTQCVGCWGSSMTAAVAVAGSCSSDWTPKKKTISLFIIVCKKRSGIDFEGVNALTLITTLNQKTDFLAQSSPLFS